MKLKSMSMGLALLLFVIGILEFAMMFMKIEIPIALGIAFTILIIIASMFKFMEVRKIRKLAYPLIIIYSLIVMPFIGRIVGNKIIYMGITMISFIAIIVFLYKDLIISNKEKTTQN